MSHPYKKRSRRGRSYSGHTYRSREYRLRQYRKRRIRRRLLFSLCLLTLLLVGGHIILIYAGRGHTKPGRTEPDKQTGQTNVPGQEGDPAKLPDPADDTLAKTDGTGSRGNSQTSQTGHTGSGGTGSSSNSSDSDGTGSSGTDGSGDSNDSADSNGAGSSDTDASSTSNDSAGSGLTGPGSTDGSGKNGSGTGDGSAGTGEDEDPDPSEMDWTPGGDEPETEGADSSTEEGEFNFENALFIGDSRTEGLFINTGLTEATFYAVRGLNVENIYTKSFIKDKTILAAKEKEESSKKKSKKNTKKKKDEEEEEDGVTIMEALKYHSWRKIYIMLGVNELGWAYESIFIDRYTDLIRDIRELQPEAEIVIQSILPVTKEKSDNDEIYNNKRISRYNKLIQAMAEEEDVTWADLTPAVSGKNGALPKKGSSDGVHLTKSYYIKWLDYLIEHEI